MKLAEFPSHDDAATLQHPSAASPFILWTPRLVSQFEVRARLNFAMGQVPRASRRACLPSFLPPIEGERDERHSASERRSCPVSGSVFVSPARGRKDTGHGGAGQWRGYSILVRGEKRHGRCRGKGAGRQGRPFRSKGYESIPVRVSHSPFPPHPKELPPSISIQQRSF